MSYGAFVQKYFNKKTGFGKRTVFFCNKCRFRTISLKKIINHMKNGHAIPLTEFLGELDAK